MGTMTVPDKTEATATPEPAPPPKKLTPAAERALAEAEARRKQIDAEMAATQLVFQTALATSPSLHGRRTVVASPTCRIVMACRICFCTTSPAMPRRS